MDWKYLDAQIFSGDFLSYSATRAQATPFILALALVSMQYCYGTLSFGVWTNVPGRAEKMAEKAGAKLLWQPDEHLCSHSVRDLATQPTCSELRCRCAL